MLILVVLIVVFWIRELRILNENLERRVADRTTELRAAQAELLRKERLATLGQLTATVSHELRNPMGVIRTSAYIVRRSLAGESGRVQRAMERIERNVIRCDRIIDELLDFARIKELVREPTAIDAWLDQTLGEQVLPPEIVLRRDFNLSNAIIPIDHDRFRRAVINVFDNACQAMAGEGVENAAAIGDGIITVRSQEREGRAELVFQDTGPGIPPEIREKIFEPLYSTKGFGVGLGLPTVQQIMEQHDGGVEIENVDGGGTQVTLWLPYTNSR
jgi:signal transduction histidine kinase